ncbi:MAG: PAS domain S-box protein, partial [bacterium]
MKIGNLKIGTRLVLGFSTVVIMTAIVGLINFQQIENLWDNTESMYRHPLVVSNAVRDIRANIIAMHRSMKDVAMSANDDQVDEAAAKVQEHEKEVYHLFDTVFERFLGDKSDVEGAHQAFSNWKSIRDEVIQLVLNDERDKAAEITKGKGARHVAQMNNKIQTMIDFANEKANSFYADAEKTKHNVATTLMGSISSILILSVFVGLIISRSITSPIREMAKVSGKIESGNYCVRNKISTSDEIGFLAQTINNMAASMQSHHDHLEEMVEKRTTELQKTNEQLRQEISERKRAEDALRKLSHAVEQSPVSIIITDTEGNIEYVNPKFKEVTGYTSEEVFGKSPRILKFGETPPEEYKRLWETITSGKEWRGEFHNKKKNGELYWELASISPVTNLKGEITHFLAVKEDITERKRADEQIRNQNVLLEKAVQEKQHEMEHLMERLVRQEKLAAIGQISGSIAHELRNPLGAIKQSIFFLNRLYENNTMETSNAKVKEHLNLVAAEIDTADRVISDLLQMTKVEALKKQRTNLRSIISEAIAKSDIKDRIQIEIELNPEPFLIWVDPLQFRQMLLNLLSNAAHAISRNGAITIHAKMTNRRKKCLLAIQDSGCGIDPEFH